MSFGTCNFIAEINKGWPRASALNSCCNYLADGEIAAVGLLGSPCSVGPNSGLAPNPAPFTPGHSRHHSFPTFTEGLLWCKPGISTPLRDLFWLLSFSNTNQNQTNHYFSMLHSTGWVIKAPGDLGTLLSHMRKNSMLGCMLMSVTALTVCGVWGASWHFGVVVRALTNEVEG